MSALDVFTLSVSFSSIAISAYTIRINRQVTKWRRKNS